MEELSTTVFSLICRNTGSAAWLLLVFMKKDPQLMVAHLLPYLGLNNPHSARATGGFGLVVGSGCSWDRKEVAVRVGKTQGQRPKKYKHVNSEGRARVWIPGYDVERGKCWCARVSIKAQSLGWGRGWTQNSTPELGNAEKGGWWSRIVGNESQSIGK